jgi:hypothetical protein
LDGYIPIVTLKSHRKLFVVAGLGALFCAPAILISETFGRSDTPWHVAQLVLVSAALVASASYLYRTRRQPSQLRRLAWFVAILSSAWVAFLVVVVVFYATTMKDFD